SPQHSIQVSATIPWISETTGPSTRAITSRHIGLPRYRFHHQSATPAPPTNATVPSTTSSSRWVRLFRRLRRYHVKRWYPATRHPASVSGLDDRRNAPKLPVAS